MCGGVAAAESTRDGRARAHSSAPPRPRMPTTFTLLLAALGLTAAAAFVAETCWGLDVVARALHLPVGRTELPPVRADPPAAQLLAALERV